MSFLTLFLLVRYVCSFFFFFFFFFRCCFLRFIQTEDDVPNDQSLWSKIQKLKDESLADSARFLLKEKEGRKRVLSRDISLTSEQLQVMEDTGENEARATHSASSAVMRNKKQKAAAKEAQLSKDVGNWRPRVPRKGERLWTKQFSTEVDKLQSKKKLMDKIAIFKNFHRELQDETFTYKNQNDQNRGRQDLLDVGEWLLENLDQSPYADRNLFFGSILFIIKRQEFNVCDMEFDVSLKPTFSSQTIITLLRYRKFLFDTQLYVQKKLQQPGSYAALLSFCASILAINYFYIEGLPDLLLSRCWPDARAAQVYAAHPHLKEYAAFVQKADDAETLEETKQKDMYLGGAKSSPSIAYFCTLRSLFVALQAAASKKDKNELSALKLDTKALDADWLQRMVDGGDFFHIFLLEWLAQIAYFIGSYKKIRWGLIQGYYKWVSIVFYQMMTKSLAEWTEEFIQVSDSLLLNPKLLSVYIKITFRKTNVFITEEVESTLRLVDGWIDLLPVSVDEASGRIEPLHATFDYDFFLEGLRVLFDSEHFVVLLETLLLLYNHLDRFVGVHRVRLVDDFLLSPAIFTKLFLCWNHHVRHVYHLILVYKLARFRPEAPGDSDGVGTIDPALAPSKSSADQAAEFAARTAALVNGPAGRCGAAGLVGARGNSDDDMDDDDGGAGVDSDGDDESAEESESIEEDEDDEDGDEDDDVDDESGDESGDDSGTGEDDEPLPPPGVVAAAAAALTSSASRPPPPPPATDGPPVQRNVPPPPPPTSGGDAAGAAVKTSNRVPPPPPSIGSGGVAPAPAALLSPKPPPPPAVETTATVTVSTSSKRPPPPPSSDAAPRSADASTETTPRSPDRVVAPPDVAPPQAPAPPAAPPVPPPEEPATTAPPPPPRAADDLAGDDSASAKKAKKEKKKAAAAAASPATSSKSAANKTDNEPGTKWNGAQPAAPPKPSLDNSGLPTVLPPPATTTPRTPDQLPAIVPPPLTPTSKEAKEAKDRAASGKLHRSRKGGDKAAEELAASTKTKKKTTTKEADDDDDDDGDVDGKRKRSSERSGKLRSSATKVTKDGSGRKPEPSPRREEESPLSSRRHRHNKKEAAPKEYPAFGFDNAPKYAYTESLQTYFVAHDERKLDQHLQRKAAFLVQSVRRQCSSASAGVEPADFTLQQAIYGRYSLEELLQIVRDFEAFCAECEVDELMAARVCPSLDQDAIMERDFHQQQKRGQQQLGIQLVQVPQGAASSMQ
jgi:hypothetical protein